MSEILVRSIKCDNCGEELIEDSSYPAKYSLELTNINTGINTTGVTYLMDVKPSFRGSKHFCGKTCLANWCKDGM